MLRDSKRPLFWFGHGIRLAGAVDLIEPFLEKFNVPFITSWQGKDMVDHNHIRYFGHAGVYGHRAANHIVQEADLIIAIGTRLALPQTGYDLTKFAPKARLVVVDIDEAEATKHQRAEAIVMDAGVFMRKAMAEWKPAFYNHVYWITECDSIENELLGIDYLARQDNGYINPYRFMQELNKWLKPDQVIVTDMGTALLCAYPMLKLNGSQRLITSTGLGEMGFGLPAAIGASISLEGKDVLCLNCDGGMMMNIQELATIKHHNLPVKIVIFANQGYAMIKRSQEGLKMRHTASGTGDISFPNWYHLARAYDIDYMHLLRGYERDMETQVRGMLDAKGPYMLVIDTDPDLRFGPKTKYGQSLEVME